MSTGGIVYKCFKCGYVIPYERLRISPSFKCPRCGFKVLVKVRPSIVKKVKAV